MFMGEFNHTVDSKGRIIMPSKFREELGETFVVTVGLDGCLFVFDMKEWDVFEKKLEEISQPGVDVRTLKRYFMSKSCTCEVDKQGRILISQSLRERAHLTKDVVLVGVGSRIEIWDKARWNEVSAFEGIESIVENLEGLAF